jgi:3-hydroxyisobutyrate dehydrogenase-like beta-hydroxyacid dehydrogenase
MAKIAYLGCGLLGSAFAQAAAERGDQVTAWNRSQDKLKALTAFGITPAATPAEAVKGAERVHMVLKDDAVVEEVIAAARAGLLPNAVLLDHSTTLPALTLARAKRLQAEGINYLHCPVFMGPPAARAAKGVMMIAGPKELFESVQEALAAMTGKLQYLGEQADLAAAHKLFGNAAIIGLVGVMADVLTLAQASGVDGVEAMDTLGWLDFNGMVKIRGKNMANADFNASFELAMARKDVGLMLEAVDGRPMSVLPGMATRMDQLIAAGHGALDTSALGLDAAQKKSA